MQGDVGAVVVGQLEHLLYRVDMKDAPCVDNILTAQTYKELLVGELAGNGRLHL